MTRPLRRLPAALALLALALAACGEGSGKRAEPWEARRVVFLSHILFAEGRQPPQLQRRRAEQALDLIQRGTPFHEVAKAQSEDPQTRDGGGFLGLWDPMRQGLEGLEGALQILAEGQTAGPVHTELGWHVLHRHPYAEGRRMEQERVLPMWGLTLSWRELPDGADRSKEEAEALARRLVAELRRGTLTLTGARAEHAPRIAGRPDGWMGMLVRGRGTEVLFDKLSTTPVNEYAEPFLVDQGWAVLKRTPLLRAIVRHILVRHVGAEGADITERLMEPEAQARAEEALGLARANLAQWDDIVRRFSDEVATAQDSGTLGCVGPTELEPEMEAAVMATPPGSLCPRVVKTRYGFHVVWRVD